MSISGWLPKIRDKLNVLCQANAVPLGVVVGWIAVESDGRMSEVTSRDERGYFQLDPRESKDLGLDHLRLSSDVDYSLWGGFQLIAYHRRFVRRLRIPSLAPGSELAWRMVKYDHCVGPGMLSRMVADAIKEDTGVLGDWGTWSAFCHMHDQFYLGLFDASPLHWVDEVNRCFMFGDPYGVDNASIALRAPEPDDDLPPSAA